MISKLPGQSLLDICVQYTGTIETLFDLMHLNSLGMDEIISEPIQLILPTISKKAIVNHINSNNIQIATDLIIE